MKVKGNPSTLAELNERIGVVSRRNKIKTGYILKCLKKGDAELKRYVNGKETKEENIYVGYMMFDDFDSFIKELREYTGRKKVYLSKEYANILLNYLKEREKQCA